MTAHTGIVDHIIARIASGQHGVVTRRQLTDEGITRHEIALRLARGSLLRVHRGVYRVGHRAPSLEATYLAAVLAGGDGALLVGAPAAHLYGFVRGRPPLPEIIARGHRSIEGVTTHRWRRMHPSEATRWRDIPVTSVPRTLVDLARVLDGEAIGLAVHEAGIRFGTTPRDVERVLRRRPTSPGAALLRRVIHGDVHVILSHLERAFLRLLRAERLPLPRTNIVVSGRRVDCRWPDLRLTVELDGYQFHSSRHAWELDRRREREARARGDEFRRFTYGDVLEDPSFMLPELRELIGQRSRLVPR